MQAHVDVNEGYETIDSGTIVFIVSCEHLQEADMFNCIFITSDGRLVRLTRWRNLFIEVSP